jgi:hypothetical protein
MFVLGGGANTCHASHVWGEEGTGRAEVLDTPQAWFDYVWVLIILRSPYLLHETGACMAVQIRVGEDATLEWRAGLYIRYLQRMLISHPR